MPLTGRIMRQDAICITFDKNHLIAIQPIRHIAFQETKNSYNRNCFQKRNSDFAILGEKY